MIYIDLERVSGSPLLLQSAWAALMLRAMLWSNRNCACACQLATETVLREWRSRILTRGVCIIEHLGIRVEASGPQHLRNSIGKRRNARPVRKFL